MERTFTKINYCDDQNGGTLVVTIFAEKTILVDAQRWPIRTLADIERLTTELRKALPFPE